MKTKRSMKDRICTECAAEIDKGSQYAQRSKRMGSTGMPNSKGEVNFWQPYYIKVDICKKCADK